MVTGLNASTNRYLQIPIPCALWIYFSTKAADNLREKWGMLIKKKTETFKGEARVKYQQLM